MSKSTISFAIPVIALTVLYSCSFNKNNAAPSPQVRGTNCITIHIQNDIAAVNAKMFGNNVIADDPSLTTLEPWAQNYYTHMDYGDGVWDPSSKTVVPAVIDLMTNAGISVLRFPGGCGAHKYDWKGSIGPSRSHFLFGLDEFMTVAASINAEAVITISDFQGTEQDAADLVEYLNAPNDGSNPNGGTDWASQRAGNGHPAPYGVKYFEIGNETWHGNHLSITNVSPQDYAVFYTNYYTAMKAVDPTIQIGMICNDNAWNEAVLPIVQNSVDFFIVHYYPSTVFGSELATVSPHDLFAGTLAMPDIETGAYINQLKNLGLTYAGKTVPIAITEFNGGFFQNTAVPYRHTLGCALINAEIIRILMKPENNILFANNWHFLNIFWGMVANGFESNPSDLYNAYHKRPNYYVFEMYRRHFGTMLIQADVVSESYNTSPYCGVNVDEPYLSVNASRSSDKTKVFIMLVNKNLDQDISVDVVFNGFLPDGTADIYTLWGDSITAVNEDSPYTNVVIASNQAAFSDKTVTLNLHKGSLTAVEVSGTPE